MIKDFKYLVPKTVKNVLSWLSQHGEEAKVIAGGQSLIVLMKQGLVAPRYLIDIKGISGLDYINFDEKKGLRIGSLTSHRAIELSPVVRKGFGVLAQMEQRLASVQVRNWGTIGGNLCHADPAGDPAPPLIALKARVKIAGRSGERSLPLEEFFKDYYETALQADEILTEIQVPNPPPHTGTAYTKFTIMETDHAIVSVAVSLTLGSGDGVCGDARIVLGAAASVPMRAQKAEKVLVGKKIRDNVIEDAAQVASEESRPTSDVHGSEEYRRELVRVLVKRVAKEAIERAERA
jgi:carbon-monoxide dehydrogenase medium subunit